MIFNEKYNKTIELISQTNEEFKSMYIDFINSLPEKALSKCKKMKKFSLNEKKENMYIDLETHKNNEAIELCIESEKNDLHILLTLNEIKEKELKELPIEAKDKDLFVIDIGDFSIGKNNKEIEFDFLLSKIDNNNYKLTTKKTISKMINNKLIIENEKTSKTYTYNDLVNKLQLKTNNR